MIPGTALAGAALSGTSVRFCASGREPWEEIHQQQEAPGNRGHSLWATGAPTPAVYRRAESAPIFPQGKNPAGNDKTWVRKIADIGKRGHSKARWKLMDDAWIVQRHWDRDGQDIPATAGKCGTGGASIAKNTLVHQEEAGECANDTYMSVWSTMPPHRPNVSAAFLGKLSGNESFSRHKYNTAENEAAENCLWFWRHSRI